MKQLYFFITIIFTILLISSCSVDQNKEYWFLNSQDQMDTSGPWFGSIKLTTSIDGTNFDEGTLFSDHAGVPHILQTTNGTLIASYQYFDPFNEEIFDVFAYKISNDNGLTWGEQNYITIEGFPKKPKLGGPMPVDPTLIQLEDGRFRLYFTFHEEGETYPHLSSAIASNITDTFEYEGIRLQRPDANLLDPAVVYFNEQWHHFTWTTEQNEQGLNKNIHSVSDDGINFIRQDDIYLPMSFLGQAIEINNELYFYGTGKGIPVAKSLDSYNWEMDHTINIQGADPGITYLLDESFLIIYTNMNFNK